MKRFFIAQVFLLMITVCGYLISNMSFADESYPYTAVPAQPQAYTGEVDVNSGTYALPPTFVIPAPPPVILIPGTCVYYVPDVEVDILFCHGDWYRPYGGRWYIARHYNGPWECLIPPRVPRVLINLPLNHRSILSGNRRIPHEDLKKNWGRWERERHLERGEGFRGEGPHGHAGRGREKGLR